MLRLFIGQFGIYGQGQRLPGGGFTFRKVALAMTKVSETLLKVQRDGVEDLAGDRVVIKE